MPPTKERHAEWRRGNRARRVLIDGRLVAAHLPAERHGRESTWADHGCQCEPCLAGHNARVSASKKRRRTRWSNRRVLVDGRLYSPDAPRHGTPSAYGDYGCRCEPCTEVTNAIKRKRRAAR